MAWYRVSVNNKTVFLTESELMLGIKWWHYYVSPFSPPKLYVRENNRWRRFL